MPRCAALLSSCLVALTFLLPPAASSARTWYVSVDMLGDAPTIQAGIDSAAVGDTVLVGPGTYHEQINFLGKDIVVRGELGAAATILDGTGLPGLYGVQFVSGETRAAMLQEMTVAQSPNGIGVFESEPSIVGNVVSDNGGLQYALASAIVLTGNGNPGPWSPLIEGNVISNNVAGWTGPGIYAQKKMIPEILDNTIVGNHAGIGDGGGIYVVTSFDGTIIRGNWIEGNYAGDHGGGIYAAGFPSPVLFDISENIIWNNTADGRAQNGESGGGIWLQETNAWVHHNTIVQNAGNGPNATYGGGIVLHEPGSPLIEQNIIALSSNGGGIFCHSGVTPTIRDNLAWQNVPVEGVGLCSTWWQSDGNLVADPMFCGLGTGDFTVAESSPAITHPAGPLGAYPLPGCAPTVVQQITWGRLKARFVSR